MRAKLEVPERVAILARAHEIDIILITQLAAGAGARKTSSRRSTICTAGKLASWLRLF